MNLPLQTPNAIDCQMPRHRGGSGRQGARMRWTLKPVPRTCKSGSSLSRRWALTGRTCVKLNVAPAARSLGREDPRQQGRGNKCMIVLLLCALYSFRRLHPCDQNNRPAAGQRLVPQARPAPRAPHQAVVRLQRWPQNAEIGAGRKRLCQSATGQNRKPYMARLVRVQGA